MVQNDRRLAIVFGQLKSDDRVHTIRPVEDAPRLNDPRVGNKLDIPSGNEGAESKKRPALRRVDPGLCAGELRKFT